MSSPPFREPTRITDLAEYAADYIEFMRATPDNSACEALIEYAAGFFTHATVTGSQLELLALMFVDRVYLYAADLSVKDLAATSYFSRVTRYVLDIVAIRGVRVFYILDNTIRQDRFEILMELLFHSGVYVVTPYRSDGSSMPFAEVGRALEIELLAGRHVAYIEKDATVDYLKLVADVARATDRFVLYRNEAPTSHRVQHLVSQRPPALG